MGIFKSKNQQKLNKEDLWKAVLGEIESTVSEAQFVTWFKGTSIIKIENHIAFINVAHGFAKEWLENKFNGQILKALNKYHPEIKNIQCLIDSSKKNITTTKKIDAVVAPKNNSKQATHKNDFFVNYDKNNNLFLNHNFSNLNPRYTFENFIIGENNQLAHAACLSVTENLGTTYNPLFIYGGVGLGKTHLLQAVGNKILENNSLEKKVYYTSSEDFTNEIITSIQNKTIENVKNKYKQVDLLIIDDIQFISGKEITQDIFFHIFNFLYQINKQIIISSDRSPKNISVLEERLRSRFEGGMIVDISLPDLETRIAILKSKIEEKNFFLKDNLIEYIAQNIQSNIRELEGILNKIIAISQLKKINPNLDFIKSILKENINNQKKKGITHKHIIKVLADFYGINENDFFTKTRKKRIAFPRQIGMYLMKTELNASFPWIGDFFGGRDHSTAIHGYEKIKQQLQDDEKLQDDLNYIKDLLYSKK